MSIPAIAVLPTGNVGKRVIPKRQVNTAFGVQVKINDVVVPNRMVEILDRKTNVVMLTLYTDASGVAYTNFLPLHTVNELYVLVKGTDEEGVQPKSLDFIKSQLLSPMESPIIYPLNLTEGVVSGAPGFFKARLGEGWHVPKKVFVKESGVWKLIVEDHQYSTLRAEHTTALINAVADKETELTALHAPALQSKYDEGYAVGLAAGQTAGAPGDIATAEAQGYEAGYKKGSSDGYAKGLGSLAGNPDYTLPANSNLTDADDTLFESAIVWNDDRLDDITFTANFIDPYNWYKGLYPTIDDIPPDFINVSATQGLTDFGWAGKSLTIEYEDFKISYPYYFTQVNDLPFPRESYKIDGRIHGYKRRAKITYSYPRAAYLAAGEKHLTTNTTADGYGLELPDPELHPAIKNHSFYIPVDLSQINQPVVLEAQVHRKTAVSLPKLKVSLLSRNETELTNFPIISPVGRISSLNDVGEMNQGFPFTFYKGLSADVASAVADNGAIPSLGEHTIRVFVVIQPTGIIELYDDSSTTGFRRKMAASARNWFDSDVKHFLHFRLTDCFGENGDNAVYINPGHKQFKTTKAELAPYIDLDQGYTTLANVLGMTDTGFGV